MISLIVAMANKNVIGNEGGQPFYISADLKRFKQLTTGHTVIMGRKTFQAIMDRLGHPLPNRKNVVISSTLEPGEGYEVDRSLENALQDVDDEEVFVIGGGQIYLQAFPKADKIFLTRVDADFDGDTFFPEIKDGEWNTESEEKFGTNEDSPYPYRYITLVRK